MVQRCPWHNSGVSFPRDSIISLLSLQQQATMVFIQVIAPKLAILENELSAPQYIISEELLGLLILFRGAFICCYGRPESDSSASFHLFYP